MVTALLGSTLSGERAAFNASPPTGAPSSPRTHMRIDAVTGRVGEARLRAVGSSWRRPCGEHSAHGGLESVANCAGSGRPIRRYTWGELEALVGGLPASATNHRAWWSGDRPHVNAWRHAGFTVAKLVPGREVTFVRVKARSDPGTAVPHRLLRGEVYSPGPSTAPRLLLITCVKKKLSTPAPARDLYVSSLFKKELAYAERSGLPWFILSAEHGLVAPDEWLAPYERYLPDTPSSFREVWGLWVAERLTLLEGSLRGAVIEIHAGAAYVDALRGPLAAKGATLVDRLAGLTVGQRLAWYAESARPE